MQENFVEIFYNGVFKRIEFLLLYKQELLKFIQYIHI